jgi:hypothetical protein
MIFPGGGGSGTAPHPLALPCPCRVGFSPPIPTPDFPQKPLVFQALKFSIFVI